MKRCPAKSVPGVDHQLLGLALELEPLGPIVSGVILVNQPEN